MWIAGEVVPYTEDSPQFPARRSKGSKGMNFITTRRRLVKDKAVREEKDREPEKAGE
jgi:hypothetical protein